MSNTLIVVALDKPALQNLLNGLYFGAKRKSLRVVCSAQGFFHVESKDLRIVVEPDNTGTAMQSIGLHNEKLSTRLTAEEIAKMGFSKLAGDVVRELADKYNSTSHNLADNIYVFGKTYGH